MYMMQCVVLQYGDGVQCRTVYVTVFECMCVYACAYVRKR